MQIQITREYIKKLENFGEGKINWDKWNEVQEITRKELEKIEPQTKEKKTNESLYQKSIWI